MEDFVIEWKAEDVAGAIKVGFHYLEMRDEIVGFLYACPNTLKRIVLAMPEEIRFDYIPDGIGFIRTAYLMRTSMKENVLKFYNDKRTIELRLILV
jgi:hypothetical protein